MNIKQRVNKKQKLLSTCKKKYNIEIDSLASSGGQGKYTKAYLSLRLRQHCQFSTSPFVVRSNFFEGIDKSESDWRQFRNHTLHKNFFLENIRSVVQQVVMTQTNLTVWLYTIFTKCHITNKCTNCMSFVLNHFFKTLSLLLHVSIAYRLSSSGSTYSS